MDGVIIDSEPVYFKIEKQMFEQLKVNVSFEEHCTYVGTSSQNMWDAIVKKHGIASDPDELVKKEYIFYMDHLANEIDLDAVEGVIELIKDLHENNFKLIIASSSHMDVIDMILKRFDLSQFFAARVSGTDLVHSKPHPEIFLRSAKLVTSEPRECIVVEDSENGITAAKAAGMKCIGFANPNSGNQDLSKADVVIKSFKNINADFVRSL